MPRTKASLRRFILVTGVATTLFGNTGTADTFGLPKLLVLLLGTSAVLLLSAPVLATALRQRRTEALVLGVFVAGFTVAALASHQAAYLTLYGAIGRANGWLCYTALAVVMGITAFAFDDPLRVARVLAVLGSAMAAYGLLQYVGIDPIDWHRGFIVKGTFGNPDFASGFLGIVGVVLLGLALRPARPRRERLLVVGALLLTLVVIRLSLAIQGLLGFAIGATVLGGLLLLGDDRSERIRRLRRPYVAAALVLSAVAVLGMTDRGPAADLLFKASVQHRFYMWQAALRMFQIRPFTGVGVEAYNDWYRTTRSAASVHFLGPELFSNAAHSVLLNLLATGGLAVVLPYLAVWVLIARAGIGAARRPETRIPAAILTGAWVAYVADSLVSMDQIGIAVWGWMLGGAVLALAPARVAAASPTGVRIGAGAAIIAAVLGVGTVAYAARIDAEVGAASRLATTTAAERAVAVPALLAAAKDCPEPIRVLGLVDELRSIGAMDASIRAGRDAVARFPREVLLWQLLATDYEESERWGEAIAVREHIRTLDPLNSDSLSQLALDRAAAG